ncbi:unnamed protein product, partial [Clonostachys rosea f. rosea IK726]|jgi:E3 ubiquitin-protein ligase RNF14
MHYNTVPGVKVTSCYMRLWELEEADGDDVGIEYGGGRARQEANNPPPPAVRAPTVEAADQALFRPEPPNERGVASEAWPAGAESCEHSTVTNSIPQKLQGRPKPL